MTLLRVAITALFVVLIWQLLAWRIDSPLLLPTPAKVMRNALVTVEQRRTVCARPCELESSAGRLGDRRSARRRRRMRDGVVAKASTRS